MTADPVDRRQALLAGAVDHVLEHGLGGLSLRPLAAALGTSDRMLVYHFGGKDRLVDDVLAEASRRLGEAVLASVAAGDGTDVVAHLWSTLSAPEVAPHLRLYFELYGLSLRTPERYRPHLVALVEAWHALAAALLAEAGHPDAEERTTLVVAGVEGLLLDLLVTGDRPRLDAAAAELARRLGA